MYMYGSHAETAKIRGLMDLSHGVISERSRNTSDALIRPNCSFHLAAFSVLKLSRIGKQSTLARTLETFKMDASPFSKMGK